MTVGNIWVDVGNLAWAVLSAEYWVTAGVGIATAAAATGILWWNSRAQPDTRPGADIALAATMVVTGVCIWGWFAYPAAVLWWLFNLVAFGGVALVALFKRSAVLLGGVTLLFVTLVAMRFVSLVDLDGAASPILLSAAVLTASACIYSGSLVMRVVPLVAPYVRIVAAVGLALAASSLHVMGYGAFWRWETTLVWYSIPAEYWAVVAVGWLLAVAGVGFSLWRRGRSGYGGAVWEAGAVAAMAALTLAMWLGLMYGVSMWEVFNLALLAGIAALLWYAYRRRQRSVA